MSANGYSDSAAFTAGKDGSYIDSNSIIWVKESLLWQAFGNVIDPPLKVDSPKDTVIKKLEEIPLTNYLQAAIGRDLYGNQLSSTQRLDKLGIALD
ncbi:MAG: hypothetical protein LBL58_17075 [Tannerellaceae bacterium]|jgi:hypothetical protein|nr:hypothetical protein [Tannerellaceae bacterium]